MNKYIIKVLAGCIIICFLFAGCGTKPNNEPATTDTEQSMDSAITDETIVTAETSEQNSNETPDWQIELPMIQEEEDSAFVTHTLGITTEMIKERSDNLRKYCNTDITSKRIDSLEKLTDIFADAIAEGNLFLKAEVSNINAEDISVASVLDQLEHALLEDERSEKWGGLDGYSFSLIDNTVDVTIVYVNDSWSTLDPDLNDLEQMKVMLNTSEDFSSWRYVLTYMQEFDEEKQEIAKQVLGTARYFSYGEIFNRFSLEHSEEDMKWYLQNIFHLSDEQYEAFRKDQAEQFRQNGYGYHDGMYNSAAGGAPVVDETSVIDSVEFRDGLWYIEFHRYYNDGFNPADVPDSSGVAAMEREQIDGEWYWTIYALNRN